jgi:hypothetical protein
MFLILYLYIPSASILLLNFIILIYSMGLWNKDRISEDNNTLTIHNDILINYV